MKTRILLGFTFTCCYVLTTIAQCSSFTTSITNSGLPTGCGYRTLSATATGDAWTQKANVGGSGRLFAFAFAINNKGYVGTGSAGTSIYNDMWEYDPATNAWTQKADFGGGYRAGASGFAIGSKGYAGMGYDGSMRKDLWEYDPAANTWTQKADMGGLGRYMAVGFAVNAKGYIGTGTSNGSASGALSDFWEYDPATNTWTQKANFGGGVRYFAVGLGIGTKGYIGTGSGSGSGNFNDFWEFDPLTNSWAQKMSVGTSSLQGATAFAIANKGYIVAGYNATNSGATNYVWQFDPFTNSWLSVASLPSTGLTFGTGFTLNGKGYFANGGTTLNSGAQISFWEYEPAYTYIWSTGATSVSITGSGSNSYSVLVTSAGGCTASATHSLALAPDPTISVNNTTNICAGTPYTLIASGASSYTWSANAGGVTAGSAIVTPTTSTIYTVSGTSGTCTIDHSFLLNVNSSPSATITAGSPTTACGNVTLNAQGNSGLWSQKAGLAYGRSGPVAFSIGNKGYIGLGCSSSFTYCVLKDFWEYDPATNAWTQKADFAGMDRLSAVAFSIGNKGYVGTGDIGLYIGLSDFWEFDPVVNTWTQKANVGGGGRYAAVGFSLGGKGYIGTGSNQYWSSYKKDMWEYNPATDTWTQKNNYGSASRYGASCFTIGNKAYVGNGFNSGNFYTDFWEYNPVNDGWTAIASCPVGAISTAAFSVGGKGYLGTGLVGSGVINAFLEYDPGTGAWTQKPNFPGVARSSAAGFSIGNKGYLGCGTNNVGDLWEYDSNASILWSTGATTPSINVSASGMYSLTITSSAGCSGSATQSVTIIPNPTLTVAGAHPLCIGETTTLSANGAGTYTWSTNAGAGNSNTTVITPAATDVYTVSGTTGVCTVNYTVPITVNPLPVVSASSSTNDLCSGNTLILSGSGASVYVWSNGVINNSPFSPTITNTYTVSGTDANNCTNTAVITVSVKPSPLVSVNSGSICEGQTFVLLPNGAASYVYSGGSASVSPAATSVYTVTGTNSVGCSHAATSTLTVYHLPTVTVISGAICSGESYTLAPSGAATYTYSSGSAVVSPLTNSSYTVVGTSSAGCVGSGSAIATITVNPLPVISVSDGTLCSGQSYTFVPAGAFSYSFSPGNSAIVSPGVNTTYSVTGTSSAGCTSAGPAVASITVLTSPTIAVNSGSICAGESFTIVPTGALTYTYSGSSDVVSPNTTTSYTVTGFNAIGCPNPGTIVSTVTVYALPVITAPSGSICLGDLYTITPSGAANYSFSGGSAVVSPVSSSSYTVSGTSSAGCVAQTSAVVDVTVHQLPVISASSGSLCSGQSFNLTPGGAHSYTVTPGNTTIVSPNLNTSYSVTGTSIEGCLSAAPAIATITVITSPVVSVNSGTLCAGQVFTIFPSGALSYIYSGGDATVSPVSTESYSVIGTDANGCNSAPAISTVTVFSLPLISAANGSICIGDSFTITPSGADTYNYQGGSDVVTPAGSTNYTVTGTSSQGCESVNTLTVSITVNALPVVSAQNGTVCLGSSFTITPSGAGSYSVSGGSNVVSPAISTTYTIVGLSAAGCSGSTTVNIYVQPSLVANINVSGPLCQGETGTLSASGVTTFTWSTGSTASQITVTPQATTVYSINAVDGACTSTASATVLVKPAPVITASNSSPVLCIDQTGTISLSGAASYTWSEGTIGGDIVITPTSTSLYSFSVNATGTNGCEGSAIITQTVSDCTGLNEDTELAIRVFPNPFEDKVYLENLPGKNRNGRIEVLDLSGRIIYAQSYKRMPEEILLSGLKPGLYIFKIQVDKIQKTIRLIRE